MFDHHLDPPESPDQPECPECNDGYSDPARERYENGSLYCVCSACGAEFLIPLGDDPGPEDYEPGDWDWGDMNQPIPDKIECPHGNDPADCDACMVAADFAYDAAREARAFGRR